MGVRAKRGRYQSSRMKLRYIPRSSSAKADDPVRRAVSELFSAGDYWIPAFADMTTVLGTARLHFCLLRFCAAGRMLVRNTRKISGELECPPCKLVPAKATPQTLRHMMSSWLAQVLPECTCCTDYAGWDYRCGSMSRAAVSAAPGTGTVIPGHAATSRACSIL